MDPERWFPFDKEVMYFEAAAKLSGDDCFGLHLGTKIDPRTAGLNIAARAVPSKIARKMPRRLGCSGQKLRVFVSSMSATPGRNGGSTATCVIYETAR